MFRKFASALLASASILCTTVDPATAQSAPPVRMASNMGGGFIEFLFGDAPRGGRYEQMYQQQPDVGFDGRRMPPQGMYGQDAAEPAQRSVDPRYNKQVVEYHGRESAGTIVIDTPNKFLYLVQGDGKALRYGVGVGRPGFTWAGTKTISAKKEWPAWTPPPEMLARRPDLPRHMEGGPDNPLGARAMYLGTSLYRIHGSNEPWTIGTNVSSGCIRMRNEDVIDLYGRVGVGTRVVVI
jgi:lipoprotein-anchoring transpeptidase ErfK/SrfK